MMPIEESVNKLLRDSINLITGDSSFAIRGKQNAPQPNKPFAAINLISSNSIGTEQIAYTPHKENLQLPVTHNGVGVTHKGEEVTHYGEIEDIAENITELRSMLYSINVYGQDAIDYVRAIHIGFLRQNIQSLFYSAKIGLTDRSEVRDLSEVEQSGWSPRGEFDITLNLVGADQDIIRAIHSIDIAGEYQIRGMAYTFNIQDNV